jgi:endonuclease/exonuclease/phosphatase family metal-dependent hydrolase
MKFRGQITFLLPLLFAGLTLGGGSAPECAEMPVVRGTHARRSGTSGEKITIVSLNLARETRQDTILRDLRQAKFFPEADVWLLQEAMGNVGGIARALELDYIYSTTDGVQGLAIMSRYPIGETKRVALPRYNLRFNTRCRIALAARINGMEIVNVHLDTRITQKQRLAQVAGLIGNETARRVVGGDFNTANVRWVANTLPVPFLENHAKAMQELFVSRGYASPLAAAGSTFKLIGLPLRLDWIFARDLKTMGAGVEQIEFSDHNAVWVRIDDGS